MSVPGTQTNLNDNAFYFAPNGGGGGGGGVTSIVAGTGIGISPAGGTGAVTITNSRVSDQPVNSIQCSDGAGGFTSVNSATIAPATGTLSLGSGFLSTLGQIQSLYTGITAPIQPAGGGLYGSFTFQFAISGDGGADVVVTPLQTILANGRCIAVSMSDANGPEKACMVAASGGTGGSCQGISGQSSRYKLYIPVSGGNAFQPVVSPISGGGGAGGNANFTVTMLA